MNTHMAHITKRCNVFQFKCAPRTGPTTPPTLSKGPFLHLSLFRLALGGNRLRTPREFPMSIHFDVYSRPARRSRIDEESIAFAGSFVGFDGELWPYFPHDAHYCL